MPKKRNLVRDKHLLYTAAVQSLDADLDFFERVYRKKHGERFRRLREDFCGTAALACEWARRRKRNTAVGIDLDRPTLDWGRRRWLPAIGDAAERVQLVCSDVRNVRRPSVDVIAALNFSYFVFKRRDDLRDYLGTARGSLRNGGMLFLDVLGGPEATEPLKEPRRIPASKALDGTKVPSFTYIWEQVRFNPVDHHLECRIHFRLADGTRIRRAFVYDWRLWTLAELAEVMREAGFADTEVYVEGWDDEADEADGIFRRKKRFENQAAWVAYLVGLA